MSDLKPCNFCGGKMKIDYKCNPLRYAVIHVNNFYWTDRCYGGTDYEFASEKEAIKEWNRRAKDENSTVDNSNM